MNQSSIDFAVQEFGHRLQGGDQSALNDFTSHYGRLIRVVLSRIMRSNRAQSQFERSVLLHLRQLTHNNPGMTVVNSTLVEHICEAMLSSPRRVPLSH